MKKTIGAFCLGLMLSVSGAQAHAGDGLRRGGHMKKMVEELNLSAEQKEKVKKIHSDRTDVKAKRQAMKSAHDELEKAIKGAATDDEVRAKFAALQKTQEEFAKARFEKVLQMRAILTPEQRAKMHGPRGMHKGKMDEEGDD